MMGLSIFVEDIMDRILSFLMDAGADDVVVRGKNISSYIIKFYNNSISVSEYRNNVILSVYLNFDNRVSEFMFNTINESLIKEQLEKYLSSIKLLPKFIDYIKLPSQIMEYKEPIEVYYPNDISIDKGVNIVSEIINDATSNNKISRIAGTLNMQVVRESLKTSTGNYCEERKTSFNLSVRGFRDDLGITYQANRIATRLSLLNHETVIEEVKDRLSLSNKLRQINPGKYNLVLCPLVVANLIGNFVRLLSAYYIENSLSPFVDYINKKVAAEILSIRDYPLLNRNPGAKVFDDSGMPTKNVDIIVNGILKTYLHNWVTANKFKTENTCHAGIFIPAPYSVIIDQGDYTFEEMIKEHDKLIVISNVWYTRFQNYLEGMFSSLQRDVSFYVENGEIKNYVHGIRISDTVMRMLMNISSISQYRTWVKWWDNPYPTLAPYIMVKNVNITTGI